MITDEYLQNQREFVHRNPLFMSKGQEIQELIYFFRDSIDKKAPGQNDLEIYTFFRQSIESFNSIQILLANGFARNAAQLLRTMFEDCVTMRYLVVLQAEAKKPTPAKPYPDSIGKFRDFFYLNLIKQFRFGREHFPDVITEDDLGKVQTNYDAVAHQFMVTDCKKCDSKKVAHRWGLDLISMAKVVGLELMAFECYYQPLTFCHPSANGINTRWVQTADAIEYNFDSSHEEQKVLRNAHLLLLCSFEAASKYFSIEDDEQIWAKNRATWDEVWKPS